MKKRQEPEPEYVDPYDKTRTIGERLRAAEFVIKFRVKGREPLWWHLPTKRIMGEREALERFCGGA